MKALSTVAIVFAITSFTFSCKKDVRPNEGTELLKVESIYNNGNYFVRTYGRNGSHKLQTVRDSVTGYVNDIIIEFGGDGKATKLNYRDMQGNVMYYFEFTYDGNGRMIKRLSQPGTVNIGDDYSLYVYDGAGHLVADSQFTKGSTPVYKAYRIYTFKYTGNNVTETENYSTIAGSPVLEYRVKFEYDNALNPLKKFDNYYQYTETNSGMWDIRCVSENNVIKEHFATGNAAYQPGNAYSYTYNSSRYPWKVKPESRTLPSNLTETEFFYE